MSLRERPAAAVKLVGGRVCLDFANTAGGRRPVVPSGKRRSEDYSVLNDRLTEYSDLLAWGLRAGLLTDARANSLSRQAKQHAVRAATVWARAIALRESVYRIFAAIAEGAQPKAADLELLNHELAVAHGRVRLALGEKGSVVWEWTDTASALDQLLWLVADSAAEMLTAGDLKLVRHCGGDDCGWLFEDTSRNHSRQWCDMKDCGNLAKVRRFRTRMRTATEPAKE
jgi:predicted RNA-binding Zn ribbon-like protein